MQRTHTVNEMPPPILGGILPALFLALLLTGTVHGRAATAPLPPCGAPPFPAWPDAVGELRLAFWQADELPAGWQAPACTGWAAWASADYARLMAGAGRLRLPGGSAALLERLGKVSELAGLRYWSVTRDTWHVLIEEASALTGPDRDGRRPDFGPAELVPGRDYFYWQQEPSTSGSAVYRLRLLESRPDRLVVGVTNAGPARYFGITMLAAGKAQTLYVFQQLVGDDWGYYQLSRIGHGAHDWLPVTDASYANRAGALFRWFGGLPEDALPVWRD